MANGIFNGAVQKPSQAIAAAFDRKAAESDATSRFVQRFNDESQWKKVVGVPVFDEHEESRWEPELDANGKPILDQATSKPRLRKIVERFGVAELQRHADNSNRLVAMGKPPGLTLGHTKDEGPESQQPETVGYCKNYRVAFVPSLSRHAVLHDELIKPDRYEEAMTYPYRSVERWKRGEYFAPVAALRREPARSLGVVAYQKQSEFGDMLDLIDDVYRYSTGERVRYMDPAQAPMGGAPAAPAGGPAAPPNPQAPAAPAGDPDVEKFAKLFAQYMSNPENCAKMAAALGGGAGAGKPPAPAGDGLPPGLEATGGAAPPVQMGASMPSGSNTGLPSQAGNPPMGAQQYQMADDVVERYEATLKAMQDEIDDLKAARENSDRGERIARYGAVLGRMREQDGYQIDVADQLYECQDFTQEQFDKRVALIERLGASNRTPLGDGPIRNSASGGPQRSGRQATPLTKEQMDFAVRYQQQNDWKVSTADAQAKAREAVPG